jgi:AcrR family transcriptional regulator
VRTRGQYAKGIAQREAILERSLEVIAARGDATVSVKELGEAVGISAAGVLYHFESKEELFTEIIRTRDRLDRAAAGIDEATSLKELEDAFLRVVTHNAAVPGVVELYARLALDSASPEHPAHAYFLERGRSIHAAFTTRISEAQHLGMVDPALDAAALARAVLAAADGLQNVWLRDRTVDMAASMRAIFAALFRSRG